MAKLRIARLHVIKPNVFEPETFEPERFDPVPDEEWDKLEKEFKELMERNRRALDKFVLTDKETYNLILDNVAMESKLILRSK